jgi:hypothetical protein
MPVDVDDVNSRILEIWERHGEYTEGKQPDDERIWPRWPALYDELDESPDVLYVGLNPSFSIPQITTRIEESAFHLDLEDLRWTGYDKEVAEFLKWERAYAKREYSYFKPMRDFEREYGLSWEHIDVLVSRLTSQKKLNQALDIEQYAEGSHQHPFVSEQLDLFFHLLDDISPNAVVVENAFARDFLKDVRLTSDRYNLTPEDSVDPNTGFQFIELDSRTPIFFSGMLTGQRALDRGSRERLGWHVKQAVDAFG